MSFIVLDTDVASAALRGRLSSQAKGRLFGHTWCITFVTLAELTEWTVLRDWGPRKIEHLAAWRKEVVVIPFREQVAITWGQLQARAQKRGRPRPVNDTWIAATCLVAELPLITSNVKDFEDFAVHEGLRLIDGGIPVRPK